MDSENDMIENSPKEMPFNITMTQESTGKDENWKIMNSVQVPPLRSIREFFCDKLRFEMPPFRDLPKWNNRMLSNLLYYQTNYFAFMSLIILICALVQLRDVLIGLVAIISVAAVLIFSLSSNPTFVQARHDHTFITLGAMLLSFYFFVYAIVPVVTVLFTLSLPLLLVLVHASTRLRSLKVKINHQLERVGLKNTIMAYLLERCAQLGFSRTCATLGHIDVLGMSNSGFFCLVYELLLEKSLFDDMDLEMVEEYYLKSEWKTTISFKCVSCILVIAVVITCGFCAFHHVLGVLVCSALFICLLEATKRFCYYIVSSYVNVSVDFDSVSHQTVAVIRSREITFFGLRNKFDINATVCLRSLRLELLKSLRSEVQCHVRMSRSLCRYDNSEKLLCTMFTSEMSRLALKDDICEEFLQLSALKELWQLLFLLRSEYLRLFLLHLSRPSHRLIFAFLYLLQEILVLRNSKARLLHDLEFINYRNCCVAEKKIPKISSFLSTTDKILAYLSFASEVLSGNEISEKEKFLYVSEILRKAIELSAPEIHIEYEDIKHSNMSSNSSISESTDEAESTADELPIEKVYEGSSLVSDDHQKDMLRPSWQENESNKAVARSVVVELKARLVERMRERDVAKTTEIDRTQRMVTVEDEFREIPTVDESCNVEKHLAEKAIDQDDLNTLTSISKSNDIFQSCAELDLQQAILFRKLAPSVDFIDDPGNES
ncbi:unnamed protein product [Onchocerca ochengi]|uniref:Vezatin n=1 Tax=Onchocerca ochengi TaxID=42157 RepID=A0A182DXU1_ONCOC|nr:unnamed protein product [Onchocerca ochengi]